MGAFDWDEALATGNATIDEQHKSLFKLANALDAACEEDSDVVDRSIYALTDYVLEHFADEEALMREAGYPGSGPHHAQHQVLTGETMRYTAVYFNGESLAARELAEFVAKWLRGHIEAEDKRMAVYLRGH